MRITYLFERLAYQYTQSHTNIETFCTNTRILYDVRFLVNLCRGERALCNRNALYLAPKCRLKGRHKDYHTH